MVVVCCLTSYQNVRRLSAVTQQGTFTTKVINIYDFYDLRRECLYFTTCVVQYENRLGE